MTETAYSYAAIIKQEKLEDGTLRVYGKATDDSIDSDLQICDSEWLKTAMPDWFVSGGNIREQHSNIAAGVATDYEEKADGHYITALVVDPTSIKKVEAKVLKGFSIGIRAPRVIRDNKAAGGRIVDGQIVEVSLVDRPANPNAKLMLAKAAESGELMNVTQTSIPLPNEVFKNKTPVEEVVEVAAEEIIEPTIVEEIPIEEVVEEADKVAELLNNAKALIGTLNKFDQAFYDNAITALSDLIVVEANEQKEGSNEIESITHLLESIKHLFAWYAGEAEEGEVANVNPEVANEAAEGALCPACGISNSMGASLCMDCGYDMMKTSLADKSDEPEVPVLEEIVPTENLTEQESEVVDLAAALKAEQEETARLRAELDVAKTLSVGGGPKRTTLNKSSSVDVDGLLSKAEGLKLKAANTTDRILAKGYLAWADELMAEARKDAN